VFKSLGAYTYAIILHNDINVWIPTIHFNLGSGITTSYKWKKNVNLTEEYIPSQTKQNPIPW